jgi:radical SAM-linked protein
MTEVTKVRLRFAKCGDLRLVSHRDIMRCLERMLRRARIPIALTQGFNPRPKVTFALALGLGIESRCEVVDFELVEPLEPADLIRRLKLVAPAGFDWLDAGPLPIDSPPPRPKTVEYSIPVLDERRVTAQANLSSLLSSTTWPLTRRRPNRESIFDLRPEVIAAELTVNGLLQFRLKVSADGSARPEELLEALMLRDLLDQGAVLTRTDVELELPNRTQAPIRRCQS